MRAREGRDDARKAGAARGGGQAADETAADAAVRATAVAPVETGVRDAADGGRGRFHAVWPLAVGVALAHAGAAVCMGDGCGAATDAPLSGALFAVFACLAIAAIALRQAGRPFGDATVRALFYVAVAGESVAVAASGGLAAFAPDAGLARGAVQAAAMLCAMTAITCALRRARTSHMATATVLVFAAALLSKALCFAVGLLPDEMRCAVAAVLVLGQFASAHVTHRHDVLPRAQAADGGYFAYLAHLASATSARRVLVACAAGLGGIAAVSGLLQAFSPATAGAATGIEARLAEVALTAVLCAVFAGTAAKGRLPRAMTVGVWVVMELIAAAALVLYAAFPAQPQAGAVASATLNVLAMTYVWHLVLAFMSSGWRSPFFYASVVWGVWTGSYLLGSVGAGLLDTWGGAALATAVTGFVLLVSTQVILVRLVEAGRFAATGRVADGDGAQAGDGGQGLAGTSPAADTTADADDDGGARHAEAAPNALERLLGLDEEAPLADVRYAAMRHHAEAMGQRFLLSEREIDVLTLYAMGFTQKRVAEELHVSPTTAHTHITRIYAKTALHSRQELLDFMRTYLDS